MDESNRVVNGLWVGRFLSPVELLCLHSYLAQGHEFQLWTYSRIKNLPNHKNLRVKDAAEILPRRKVFRYRGGDHPDRYAGFSDIFRYKLLFEQGGWWADLDTVCLRPLNFRQPFVFRYHEEFEAVFSIMKCPKGAKELEVSFKRAIVEVDETNIDWHKPILILTEELKRAGLLKYINKDLSNPDDLQIVRDLVTKNNVEIDRWHALHLCATWIGDHGVDKFAISEQSTIGRLISQYDIDTSMPFSVRYERFVSCFSDCLVTTWSNAVQSCKNTLKLLIYKLLPGQGELDRIARKYGTDKSSAKSLPAGPSGYQARPADGHGYAALYEKHFSDIRYLHLHLLEIGVLDGRSLQMWREYLKHATIFGLDIDPECKKYEDERVSVFIGSQTDSGVLDEICQASGKPLDIVIDDGSHYVDDIISTFDYLFDRLADGGTYVIEDIHVAEDRDWGSVAYNEGMNIVGAKGGNNIEDFNRFMKRISVDSRVKRIVTYLDKICFIEKH